MRNFFEANGSLNGMLKYLDEIKEEDLRSFISRNANSENGVPPPPLHLVSTPGDYGDALHLVSLSVTGSAPASPYTWFSSSVSGAPWLRPYYRFPLFSVSGCVPGEALHLVSQLLLSPGALRRRPIPGISFSCPGCAPASPYTWFLFCLRVPAASPYTWFPLFCLRAPRRRPTPGFNSFVSGAPRYRPYPGAPYT
ncbi:hypothetical protein CEXT_200381 [Caerostris extrusa]|uniref:Uncharacterized protein n=1 Tax=Caerostris extrusa TaxID=172846 RepID=A0AAV4QN12_CAEEX|nr:hypothetical protein CEXT_200381 [Caerostris extrusa]